MEEKIFQYETKQEDMEKEKASLYELKEKNEERIQQLKQELQSEHLLYMIARKAIFFFFAN